MNNQKLQNDIETLNAAYTHVSLDASEKVMVKNRLFAEVDTHVPALKPVRSPWSQTFFYLRAVSVAALVLVLIGTPVAFAAEKSLPGDTLYGIKTSVNEEVRAAFVSDDARDEYYQSLLAKRASEVRVLAKRGALSVQAVEDLHDVLKDNVESALETSEASGEPEEEVLQDHQTIVVLVSLSKEIIDPVVDAVTEQQDKFEEIQAHAVSALAKHVADLDQAEEAVAETVLTELTEDVQQQLEDEGEEALVLEQDDVAVVDESEVSVAAIQVEATATLVAPVPQAVKQIVPPVVSRVPSEHVDQLLKVREQIARRQAEQVIDALVTEFEDEEKNTEQEVEVDSLPVSEDMAPASSSVENE